MDKRTRPGPGIIAMAIVGVAALLLYAWFLSAYFATAYGDAAVGQAIEALLALALLWLALLVLAALDRAVGGPSWARMAGFLVLPLTAIATVFATDYPNDPLCEAGVVGAPLLVGAYVLAGRMRPASAVRVQAAILLLFAAFSAYAIDLFIS